MEVKQLVFKYSEDGTFVGEDLTIPSFPCTEEDLADFYPIQTKVGEFEKLAAQIYLY